MTIRLSLDTRLPAVKRVNGADVTPAGGPYGAFSAEAYLVFTPEPVLVDCGGPPTYEELRGNLAALGVAPRDLRAVIGTHYHFDHVGHVAALRRDGSGLVFALNEADTAAFTDGSSIGSPPDRTHVDRSLIDGQRLQFGRATFDVIHTPGHTPGSSGILVAVDGGRALFVGDAVHGLFFPGPERDTCACMDEWADSLDRLAACEFDVMFEGHVFPVHVLGNPSALAEDERADLYGILQRRMDDRRRGIPVEEARRIMRAQAAGNRSHRLILSESWIGEYAAQVIASSQGEM